MYKYFTEYIIYYVSISFLYHTGISFFSKKINENFKNETKFQNSKKPWIIDPLIRKLEYILFISSIYGIIEETKLISIFSIIYAITENFNCRLRNFILFLGHSIAYNKHSWILCLHNSCLRFIISLLKGEIIHSLYEFSRY